MNSSLLLKLFRSIKRGVKIYSKLLYFDSLATTLFTLENEKKLGALPVVTTLKKT